MSAGAAIRRAGPGDWSVARDLRLRALREEPTAFASTYERERAFDDEVWRQRIGSSAQFLALDGTVAVGTVTALVDDEGSGLVQLVAMYVRPEARGGGHGILLVRAVIQYARDVGARGVRLSVVEQNEPARRLYARAGFVPTGRTQALPHAPRLTEIELELSTEPASVIEPVSDPG